MNASQRFLAIYSGVLTLAFGGIVLTGAASTGKSSFDTIDVQRINVREPDGTLRMVVSNEARNPGVIFRGKEYPHPNGRKTAGVWFYNDEGTENGGLTFQGRRRADGKIHHSMHLSMDQYEQDQVVELKNSEQGGRRHSGLTITDRPTDYSVLELLKVMKEAESLPEDERRTVLAQYHEGHAQRLFVGRNVDEESVVTLSDAGSNVRLRMKVEPDGAASIQFLDAAGKVTGTITPETLRQ